ncbi:hypothetical protein KUCAC02_025272, partial [Chaenocephalus aceratus]
QRCIIRIPRAPQSVCHHVPLTGPPAEGTHKDASSIYGFILHPSAPHFMLLLLFGSTRAQRDNERREG